MKAVKYEPLELLRGLDVVNFEEEAAQVVKLLLDATKDPTAYLEELSMSPPEVRAFVENVNASSSLVIANAEQVLTPEALLWARVAVQHTKTSQSNSRAEAMLSLIIPEVPILCSVVENHAAQLMTVLSEQYEDEDGGLVDSLVTICLQLLQLATCVSKSSMEEGSRRVFTAVMKRMLSSVVTPDDLVEGCVQALHSVCILEKDLVDATSEIIAELSRLSQEHAELQKQHHLRILAILSLVLERVSPGFGSNPDALTSWATHIIPAVTSENLLIRQLGVSCFGKLGLFTPVDTISEQFLPLILRMASNEVETDEIRAQALLALSDWATLFPVVLKTQELDGKMVSISDVVHYWLDNLPKGSGNHTSLAFIAAEVATKLLWSGRIVDSSWLANLVVIFFDPNLSTGEMEEEYHEEESKEIGSLVRWQQLQSVFFPAYVRRGPIYQEALLNSISHILQVFSSRSQKKPRGKSLPVVKMIDFVCALVEEGVAKADSTKSATELDNAKDEECMALTSVGLSSAVQIATFLYASHDNLNAAGLRALCKYLGNIKLDLRRVCSIELVKLKGSVEDLTMAVSDSTCLRALDLLTEKLAGVEIPDSEESSDGEESLTEAMGDLQVGKENSIRQDSTALKGDPAAVIPVTSNNRATLSYVN
jgi:condensin complex subunit 3